MSLSYGVGHAIQHNKIIRMPVNPYDKATIVSVFPKEIVSKNPTVFPGTYVIPAAPHNGFSICVVMPGSWFKEMEEGQPLLEIPVSSIMMAESIIKDYVIGMLGSDAVDMMPGLFYVPGELAEGKVAKDHADKIELAKAKQKRWFNELIGITDVMWARTNGNPRAISDDAKLAAESLGVQRDWLQNFTAAQMVRCKACGSLKNPNYPICPNCKAIDDPAKAAALGIKFAASA